MIQKLFQDRNRFVAVFSLLVFLIYIQTGKYLIEVARTLVKIPVSLSIMADWNTPGSGLETLPPQVLSAIKLLKAHSISEFSCSPAMCADGGIIFQRLSDATYPIKLKQPSSHLLSFKSEEPLANCETQAELDDVRLSLCH